jgi:hypothetical protein
VHAQATLPSSALTRLAAPAEGPRQQRCTAAILARQLLQYIAQCVPKEAPPPASPGTSDADTVSTVFWRFYHCGGPCTGSKAEAALGNPCSWSSGAGAGRCSPFLTPCMCSFCADARRCSPPPPALLACAPFALVLADARAPALLAFAPFALLLAEARPPALLA